MDTMNPRKHTANLHGEEIGDPRHAEYGVRSTSSGACRVLRSASQSLSHSITQTLNQISSSSQRPCLACPSLAPTIGWVIGAWNKHHPRLSHGEKETSNHGLPDVEVLAGPGADCQRDGPSTGSRTAKIPGPGPARLNDEQLSVRLGALPCDDQRPARVRWRIVKNGAKRDRKGEGMQ
jgi:hypothetical protein